MRYQAAVRALSVAQLEQGIRRVLGALEEIRTDAVDSDIARLWQPHRGALAIVGLWLIEEARFRSNPAVRHPWPNCSCSPTCWAEEKSRIVALQRGGGPSSWLVPQWFDGDLVGPLELEVTLASV